MRYLFSLLLLTLLPTLASAQIEMRAQALSSGNNAWDSGQDLGVSGPVYLSVYNTGSVVLHLAFTQAAATANTPAMILSQGQRWTFKCGTGCPRKIWAKGVSGIATFAVTASNKYIEVVSHELVGPDALADSTRVLVRTFTIGHADLTDADGSETETDTAGALPSNAVLMGYRKRVTTAFTGGTASAVTIDCGFNGATDVLDDGQTIFTGVAAATYGAGVNALPSIRRAIGGLTPQCTVVADDDVADLSAGSVSIDIFYAVPGPG